MHENESAAATRGATTPVPTVDTPPTLVGALDHLARTVDQLSEVVGIHVERVGTILEPVSGLMPGGGRSSDPEQARVAAGDERQSWIIGRVNQLELQVGKSLDMIHEFTRDLERRVQIS